MAVRWYTYFHFVQQCPRFGKLEFENPVNMQILRQMCFGGFPFQAMECMHYIYIGSVQIIFESAGTHRIRTRIIVIVSSL